MPEDDFASKRLRIDSSVDHGLEDILARLDERMDALDSLVKKVFDSDYRHACCTEVLHKLNAIEALLHSASRLKCDEQDSNEALDSSVMSHVSNNLDSPIPVLLVNNQKPGQVVAQLGLDSTMQVITLNTEGDFEGGSWLGDENNPQLRVRCKIPPVSLMHINSTCLSPEKMAVTLLDHLFPRELLAVSNLTGKGKHGKRQLDPLMIFGIRSHLRHRFHINEGDWYRIKQNMDSKCRTAWRKRSRGLPLGGIKVPYLYNKPMKFKSQNMTDSEGDNEEDEGLTQQHQLHEIISEDGQSIIVTSEAFMGENSEDEQVETRVLHTQQGDIQVLHATTEQLLRIQQRRHNIQVFRDDELLPTLHEGEVFCQDDSVIEEIDCSEHMLTIVTSTGETVVDMEAIENHQEFVDEDALDLASKEDEECEEDMGSVQYIIGE